MYYRLEHFLKSDSNYISSSLTNVAFYTLVFLSFPYFLNLNNRVSILRDAGESLVNPAYQKPGEEHYDYIIVGGGTAGSLLANRLSKNPKISVLLLERGGDPDPLLDVPLFAPILSAPETDYGYNSVPQSDSFYSSGNRVRYVRGIGLGGSGNLNYLQYQRGAKGCYDEWAQLTGDNVWAWDNVLKNFKKFEDYHGNYEPANRKYHSVGGELRVSPQTYTPSSSYFYETCREKGVRVQDVNEGVQPAPVFSPSDVNSLNGRRAGPYQAFIKPILGRKNLKIYRFSQVVKINFDSNKRATGVTYIRHNVRHKVNAVHEIILSAGSIDSPKILLLSGIGPTKHLNSLNIKVLVDLPVGKNLQDHVCTLLNSITYTKEVAFVPSRDLTPSSFLQYVASGTGPLSCTNVIYATGFYSTSKNPEPSIPDIQIFNSGTFYFNNPIQKPIFNGYISDDGEKKSENLRTSKKRVKHGLKRSNKNETHVKTTNQNEPDVKIANQNEPDVKIANQNEPDVKIANQNEPDVKIANQNEPDVKIANQNEPDVKIANQNEPDVKIANQNEPDVKIANQNEPDVKIANQNEPNVKIANQNEPDANAFVVLLSRPESVDGEVRLRNTDPMSLPIIDPNFFSDPSDMPRLIEGVKYIVNLFESSKTYEKIGAKTELDMPKMCKNLKYKSDEFYECYIRYNTGIINHASGTCRMGMPDDPRSVVDSRLRVLGTRNLRVIDASIMPRVVNAPINTPVYMIAQMGSEFILSHRSRSYEVCTLENLYNSAFRTKLKNIENASEDKCFYNKNL